jgi:photosystem II stability/assembly factor-like uncharacterized protein
LQDLTPITNSDDPNILFAASRYGYLYRSDDGGTSWTKLRRELSEIAAVCWCRTDRYSSRAAVMRYL